MAYERNVEAGAENVRPASDPGAQAQGRFEDEYLDYLDQAKMAIASTLQRQDEESFYQGREIARPVDLSAMQPDGGNQHTEVLPYKPIDKARPTLVIFDSFTMPVASPNGERNGSLTHGQISADAAEQRGFNVIRVTSREGGPEFGKTMPELADRVESGEIPVGRGDVLNVSAGWGISFEKASAMLGVNITADNLRDMVPQIRQRMRDLIDSPQLSLADRNWLQAMTASNDAVERIRARGVEVVAAGGNEGPERFNIAMLTATTQLSATNSAGDMAAWSANNSLTTPGQGHYELRYQRADMMNPQSIAEQQGRYQLGQQAVYFDAEKLGGVHTNRTLFPSRQREDYLRPVRPHAEPLPAELLQPGDTSDAGRLQPTKVAEQVSMVRTRPNHGDNVGLPAYPYDKYIMGWTRGTSFSNVDYLSANFERLRKLKTSA